MSSSGRNTPGVVANALPGAWRADATLTKRPGGTGVGDELEFRADAEIVANVPQAIAAKLREHRIYLAGTMLLRGAQHPFVLVVFSGNPTVIWFRERDGDPMGDSESFTVMLVRAKDRADELLFLGGDFDNQPFSAYGRKTMAAALAPAAVITDMIRLLEAGRDLEMIETYMSPADRAKIEESGQTLEKLAENFSNDKAKQMLDALRIVNKREPTMSGDGDKATWDTDIDGVDRSIMLQRIGSRWYVLDR